MPKVKSVEKKIWDLEGFDIKFILSGKDVRGDKSGIPAYPFERAAKNDMTVSEWKKVRFATNYSGYDVDVLDADGTPVPGQTKIGNLRDTYLDE